MTWRSEFAYGGSPTTLGNWSTSLDSLAGGAVALSSDTINVATNKFVDVLLEVNIANITDSGNRQVIVFAVPSIDNSTFAEFTATNTHNAFVVGAVGETGTTNPHVRILSVAAALGGPLPPYFRVGVLNDNGSTALAASGNSVRWVGVTSQAVDI